MKKIQLIILCLILSIGPLWAINDDVDDDIIFSPKKQIDREKNLIEGEHEIIFEKENIEEEISPYTKQALRGIIEKDYDLNSSNGLFNKQLKLKFNRGIVETTGFHLHTITTMEENISDSDSDFQAKTILINAGFNGKFKSKKENYSILFDLSPHVFDDFSHYFLLDAYIESTRIPHHTLLFGSSRTKIGYESAVSSKLTPFLLRSQNARNFGNARKTGLEINGDFKYVNYEIGGYSSDTRYREFFPGVETTMWVDFKPLANFDEKYGKLYLGGGLNSGNRNSEDFFVLSSALRYYYKKLWLQMEYQNADGYNGGTGFSNNKAQGYNFTLGYHLTKKLEFLLRFDEFDKNKNIENNDSREYSVGLNYYIFGQCARIILNYVFCQNEAKDDSHRIILGTQLIL